MSLLPTKTSPSLCLPTLVLSAVLFAVGGLQVLDCELPESRMHRMCRAPALPQVLLAESPPQMMACNLPEHEKETLAGLWLTLQDYDWNWKWRANSLLLNPHQSLLLQNPPTTLITEHSPKMVFALGMYWSFWNRCKPYRACWVPFYNPLQPLLGKKRDSPMLLLQPLSYSNRKSSQEAGPPTSQAGEK